MSLIGDLYEGYMEGLKRCAFCGEPLTKEYLMIGDNFLQVKYFDSDEDNRFCSENCLCKALSVLTVNTELNEESEYI